MALLPGWGALGRSACTSAATATKLKTPLETLSAPASEGRMSVGIPVFSRVMIYEKLAVCQRVEPDFCCCEASLDKHVPRNDFSAPVATSLYAAWPCSASTC